VDFGLYLNNQRVFKVRLARIPGLFYLPYNARLKANTMKLQERIIDPSSDADILSLGDLFSK
jgi:hypothetical protein